MKNLFKALAAGVCCLTLCLSAEEAAEAGKTIQPEEIASINEDMDVVMPKTSGTMMEEVFDQFAEERGITYGEVNAKGALYVKSKAAVAANASSPDFIHSRAAAFAKAYQDAVAELVLDLVGVQATQTTRVLFENASSDRFDAPATSDSTFSTIGKKINAVADASLDKALEKLGKDPSKYGSYTPQQKKNIITDSIVKESIKKAVHSAAGFLTIQTFETRTEGGNYTIGVVLRHDPVCDEVARCLAKKRLPALSRPTGLTVKEALPTNKEMISQFGVRLFFDEKGRPALLSFAQAGAPNFGKSERQIERSYDHAKKQAMNLADIQLTEFINSSISVFDNSSFGEAESEDVIFTAENTTSESVRKTIDKINQKSTMTGRDSMAGRSTVYSKILRHPSGHPMAVVVRLWSFAQLENVKKVLEGQKEQPKKPAVKNSYKQEDKGTRSGRVYDF